MSDENSTEPKVFQTRLGKRRHRVLVGSGGHKHAWVIWREANGRWRGESDYPPGLQVKAPTFTGAKSQARQLYRRRRAEAGERRSPA